MAWNEPGGEKRNPWNRPQQSQNDLDDVLRNFQRRLSALFGRGGGASGGGGGQSSAGFGKSLSSILVLIGAVWIGSGIYRVDAQERAVVLRFGKYLHTTGPGYNWHLPWPIERKIIVNVSHQYSVVDDASIYTQPWKIAGQLGRHPDQNMELMEFACVEGNQDLVHYTEAVGGKAKEKK